MRTGLYQGDVIQAILKEVRTTIHKAVEEAQRDRGVAAANDITPPPDENVELAAALDSIAF